MVLLKIDKSSRTHGKSECKKGVTRADRRTCLNLGVRSAAERSEFSIHSTKRKLILGPLLA